MGKDLFQDAFKRWVCVSSQAHGNFRKSAVVLEGWGNSTLERCEEADLGSDGGQLQGELLIGRRTIQVS